MPVSSNFVTCLSIDFARNCLFLLAFFTIFIYNLGKCRERRECGPSIFRVWPTEGGSYTDGKDWHLLDGSRADKEAGAIKERRFTPRKDKNKEASEIRLLLCA